MIEKVPAKIVFFNIIIMACLVKSAQGLMCYQCNSLLDPTCHSLMLNSTDSIHYRPCLRVVSFENQPFCRKTYQKIHARDGIVRIIRSCGYMDQHDDCYSYKNEDHEEISCRCYDDGCNDAVRRTVTTTVFVGLLLLLTFSSNWFL